MKSIFIILLIIAPIKAYCWIFISDVQYPMEKTTAKMYYDSESIRIGNDYIDFKILFNFPQPVQCDGKACMSEVSTIRMYCNKKQWGQKDVARFSRTNGSGERRAKEDKSSTFGSPNKINVIEGDSWTSKWQDVTLHLCK